MEGESLQGKRQYGIPQLAPSPGVATSLDHDVLAAFMAVRHGRGLPGRRSPKKSGLGLLVGTKTSPRRSSTAMGAQALAWPSWGGCSPSQVGAAGSSSVRGIGSQSQRGAPVLASKARTEPAGATTRALSPIADPTTTVSPTVTGGEVIWNSPGHSRGMPGSMRTSPSSPNPAQRCPVPASIAISRASLVPVKMRLAQAPSASASCQCATPRQVN